MHLWLFDQVNVQKNSANFLFLNLCRFVINLDEMKLLWLLLFQIIDLHYDSNNGSLIVRSHLREEDMFQIWSLPQLDLQYEVLARRDATCYAYSVCIRLNICSKVLCILLPWNILFIEINGLVLAFLVNKKLKLQIYKQKSMRYLSLLFS